MPGPGTTGQVDGPSPENVTPVPPVDQNGVSNSTEERITLTQHEMNATTTEAIKDIMQAVTEASVPSYAV